MMERSHPQIDSSKSDDNSHSTSVKKRKYRFLTDLSTSTPTAPSQDKSNREITKERRKALQELVERQKSQNQEGEASPSNKEGNNTKGIVTTTSESKEYLSSSEFVEQRVRIIESLIRGQN